MSDEFYFEKLDIYKRGIKYVANIYRITRDFPKNELFGLTNQVRRAAVSMVSNIAEGSSRNPKEFKRFLDIARGSLFECVGQFRIALQLEYFSSETYQLAYRESIELSKMIMGLRNSLN